MTPSSPVPSAAGWASTLLGDLCEIHSGPGHLAAPANRAERGIPLLRPMNIGHRGEIVHHDLAHVPEEDSTKVSGYRLAVGDILCVRTGSPGRAAQVSEAEAQWLFTSNLLRLRLRTPELGRYLVHYLNSPQARTWIGRETPRGVGIPSISVAVLAQLPVAVPPPDEAEHICTVLDTLAEKASVHEEIARTTMEIRERLSALLFAGFDHTLGRTAGTM
ncbi:restriction endonuclease subunit S [Kitasatospora sp. NPDC057692]|uniref:restriction endonuclease subunit S n=1 Tax=Kitasatospora sp. NPDC057692 TaxID=3346215 RepID=UPI0036B31810